VVDEAGEDLLQVEATPDVVRDPAEGLGAMQLVGQVGRGAALSTIVRRPRPTRR
jgi:hypothetical protein